MFIAPAPFQAPGIGLKLYDQPEEKLGGYVISKFYSQIAQGDRTKGKAEPSIANERESPYSMHIFSFSTLIPLPTDHSSMV